MKKVPIILSALLALAPSMAHAFWFGNPGRVIDNGGSEVSLVYDDGTRDMKTRGGNVIGLDSSRFYGQFDHGMGNGVQLFGRLMPDTGSLDLDNSSFNPDIWGLGGGVRWMPPQQSSVLTWGLQSSVDLNFGSDSGTDVRYTEIAIDGGVSYAVHPLVDLYGGASLLFDDVRLKGNGGTATLKNDDKFGLFGGVAFRPVPDFGLGFEFHVINEQVIGITGSYYFGSVSSPRSSRTSRVSSRRSSGSRR